MEKMRPKLHRYLPYIVLVTVAILITGVFAFFGQSGALVVKEAPKPSSPLTSPTRTPKEESTWKWDASKWGKIWVLDIGRNDCVECVAMHEITRSMDQEYQGKIRFDVVDLEQYPDAEKQFGITVIPTVIVADGAGREIYRKEGLWPASEIRTFFDQLGITP